jgi:hypothetical protein
MVDWLVHLDAVWEADLPNLTEIQIARGEAGSKRVARDHGRWTSILVAGEGAVVDACHRHCPKSICSRARDRYFLHEKSRSSSQSHSRVTYRIFKAGTSHL